MTVEISAPSLPPPQPHVGRGRVVAVIALIYIVFVSFAAQVYGWAAPALGLPPQPPLPGFVATLAQALVLLVPLVILAITWRTARYRAMFRTWGLAAAVLATLSFARLLPSTQGQVLMLIQCAILALWIPVLNAMTLGKRGQGSWSGVATAGALGLITALPWVVVGALGSPLDAALALLLAGMVALVASHVLGWNLFDPLADPANSRGTRRDLFTGGVAVGATLLIVASGLGTGGVQLALMLSFPALGWVIMALATLGRERPTPAARPAVGLFIGIALAAPLLFCDPDGMILEAMDPILGASLTAALAVTGVGWLLGLASALTRARPVGRVPAAWGVGAGLVALLVALLYSGGGQTGFFGDRLFVILEDQADLSAVGSIASYQDRRQAVYDLLVRHAERSQAPLRAALDGLGVPYTPYYLVNAVEVRGGLLVRLWLSARTDVDRVLASPRLRPLNAPPGEQAGQAGAPPGPQWNLTSLGADRVWSEFGARGQGIVIGLSDSGVQHDHPEVAAGYRGVGGEHDYNWLDPWSHAPAPVDFGGHGTHTLGSVLGKRVGVAPEATWIACANLQRNLGNPALYLDCLQFMLAPYPQQGDPLRDGDPSRAAHVLNNSWGCPEYAEGCDARSLAPAVAALRAAGIFVVASAGNSGPECGTVTDAIALYDDAFTVGAVDESGNLAAFSSRGPVTVDGSNRVKPDLVAPGVEILSAYPGGSYEVNSGTSMAGPHVAGVVALVWSARPELIGEIERTEQLLLDTARPIQGIASGAGVMAEEQGLPGLAVLPPAGGQSPAGLTCGGPSELALRPNNAAGYGLVDAYAAVKAAMTGAP